MKTFTYRNGVITLKKLFAAMLIIVLFASAAVPGALALVSPSSDIYVTDDARVLTERTRNDIIDANIDMEQKCDGAQIVIVTVKYLDGMFCDEYATRLFNDWGVGDSSANNGMLLLLATEEGKAWLTVGSGINGVFSNKMADEYFDMYFWDEFDARNFDTAVRNMCEELFSWYAGYYGVNQGGDTYAPSQNSGDRGNNYYQEPPVSSGRYENPNARSANRSANPLTRATSAFFGMVWVIVIIGAIIFIILIASVGGDRRMHRAYYVHMGMPIPRYHWWYRWGGHHHHPYRSWYHSHHHGPHGPGGRGGGPRGPRGPGGHGGTGSPPRSSGGRSGGGFGGFGGGGRPSSGGRSGGGFGGFGGGGGHSGGGFGGFGGGGRSGGGFGGGHSGGGGGRR
jgi:uncharacterized membrane protein YgcG